MISAASGLPIFYSDLPGAAVGNVIGQGAFAQMLLDTTAAGHGWFIDYTPYLNEEFLPTSNPNEWVAKPGSEAEGKMDMLTVLLHEYGHTLGLDHSAEAHDFMAATLQPGVRRTLSVDQQLELMRLAGIFVTPESPSQPYGPTDPGAPLPFTRVVATRSARRAAGLDSLVPQFDTAANPKLTNSEFTNGDGWSTTGNVSFSNGAATLSEGATTQTRLNQAFVVNEGDRFLSFTVANAALGDQVYGPDDAFEVALLDANTGLSLLGGTGLTKTDAALNRQAEGSEYKASGISSVANADGSRTYLVDLAGIAAGTVVNLSFDLIGFGKGLEAQNSRLTIRDLRLGVPQTTDDAVTTAEDAPLVIDALANDLNARQPGFVPVVVAGPAHGQISINADGSFAYTPDKDWFGEDRFTYKLSDGRVDSNLATVVLTVTPVNDAPVVPTRAVTLDEDGSATVDLLAGAADKRGASPLSGNAIR